MWYRWLNRGHRMVATAGTDVHGPGQQYQSRSAGFNVVYADQLSEAGILRGVAAGHLYLSAGPTLSFAALHEASGQRMMGDSLTVAR